MHSLLLPRSPPSENPEESVALGAKMRALVTDTSGWAAGQLQVPCDIQEDVWSSGQ